jgi:hypothetical protein
VRLLDNHRLQRLEERGCDALILSPPGFDGDCGVAPVPWGLVSRLRRPREEVVWDGRGIRRSSVGERSTWFAAGKTAGEVARLLEVSEQSIYKWRRQEEIGKGELP